MSKHTVFLWFSLLSLQRQQQNNGKKVDKDCGDKEE